MHPTDAIAAHPPLSGGAGTRTAETWPRHRYRDRLRRRHTAAARRQARRAARSTRPGGPRPTRTLELDQARA